MSSPKRSLRSWLVVGATIVAPVTAAAVALASDPPVRDWAVALLVLDLLVGALVLAELIAPRRVLRVLVHTSRFTWSGGQNLARLPKGAGQEYRPAQFVLVGLCVAFMIPVTFPLLVLLPGDLLMVFFALCLWLPHVIVAIRLFHITASSWATLDAA